MHTSHLKALRQKYERLEDNIHSEQVHAARDEMLIERMKKERLHLKEEIERVERQH